jgi:hypothetical protein
MRGNESLTKRKDVSCPAGKSFHLEFKIPCVKGFSPYSLGFFLITSVASEKTLPV